MAKPRPPKPPPADTVPLDLWAYRLHQGLARKPGTLEAMGHTPPDELPAELVNPDAPPAVELLEPHAEALDRSGAVVADWLREGGGRSRQLLSLYTGRGRGPDLELPLVTVGPGLADLIVVVEHLGCRKLGAEQLRAPQVPGYTVKANPVPCPKCGGRTWSATPSRARDQVQAMNRTALVDDSGTVHECPALAGGS